MKYMRSSSMLFFLKFNVLQDLDQIQTGNFLLRILSILLMQPSSISVCQYSLGQNTEQQNEPVRFMFFSITEAIYQR